jgi:hypothetical protein
MAPPLGTATVVRIVLDHPVPQARLADTQVLGDLLRPVWCPWRARFTARCRNSGGWGSGTSTSFPVTIGHLRRGPCHRGRLILGERHLRAVLAEYQMYYNMARPHQGIAQYVPHDEPEAPRATVTDIDTQQIRRKPVLRGLINEYTRAA